MQKLRKPDGKVPFVPPPKCDRPGGPITDCSHGTFFRMTINIEGQDSTFYTVCERHLEFVETAVSESPSFTTEWELITQ